MRVCARACNCWRTTGSEHQRTHSHTRMHRSSDAISFFVPCFPKNIFLLMTVISAHWSRGVFFFLPLTRKHKEGVVDTVCVCARAPACLCVCVLQKAEEAPASCPSKAHLALARPSADPRAHVAGVLMRWRVHVPVSSDVRLAPSAHLRATVKATFDSNLS